MSVTLSELEDFHAFALQKLSNEGAESLQELVDDWTVSSLNGEELQASLAALREGLADAAAGRVRPAREVFEDLAARFGVDLPG